MDTSWLSHEIDKDIESLTSEEKPVGWFSIAAVSNIPLILYPGLSKRECEEVFTQSQNVLRESRNENNYCDVAITYSLNDNDLINKYKIVHGTLSAVYIMQDEETRTMLEKENMKNDLVIVSIHNPPNDGNFSVNDLFLYEKNPSIKLMEIVNRKGEVSFLYKSRHIELKNIVVKNILEIVPDFMDRKHAYEQKFNSLLNLSEILTVDERKQIVKETIYDFQRSGVYFCQYIGKEKENDIVFCQQNSTVAMKHFANSELQLESLSYLNSENDQEEEYY